jgi:hypothetical protein
MLVLLLQDDELLLEHPLHHLYSTMVLSHLYNILLHLYSALRPYILLFPQSGLYRLRLYNFFLYNLHPYNFLPYNLRLYNLLFPQSGFYVLSIPLYLHTNGRPSTISICIWMQLRWRHVLGVMPGGLICA